MSLENSEKQELNTNKPNKISLSDEDKEFIQILGLVYPRVSRKTPSWVKKNVMDAYAKEYRYRILWRTIKTKIVEYKEDLFRTGRGLEIALASLGVFLFLSGIYLYTSTERVEISKDMQPQPTHQINYRGNSQENIAKLKQAKKFYIEENKDEEINKLIKGVYKKVSLETTKIITLDSSQNYNILISIKKDNDLLVISLSDSLGNHLCSKKYSLHANNTKDLLETIKTDLLYEFYLKE
ncbi:MAG: hypothetical protein WAQ98_03595 [Blastocatellia bacterium]